MRKTASFLIFYLVLAPGAALGQWTCDTASSVDLPYEQSSLQTMGPDSWGHWNSFVLDRPAVVEISGGPCYIPGWARAELWSECEAGEPGGFLGGYETPDLETGFFESGELALEPGAYYLDLRAFCVVDFDTWFLGYLRIVARYTIDVAVMSNINPRSRGVVPVAIFGSEYLDVSDIDVATLRFGPDQASTKHDLDDPWTYNEHVRDLNLDGFVDLVAHFPTRDAGIACGHESAVLNGYLQDGTAIEGADSIRIAGCKPRRSVEDS